MVKKNEQRNSSIFDGDGRRRIEPINVPDGTHPLPVRGAQARMLCSNFDRRGESQHSGRGSLVWVMVTHCKEQGYRYRIQTYYDNEGRSIGYIVRREA